MRGTIRLTPRGYRAFQNDPPPYSYGKLNEGKLGRARCFRASLLALFSKYILVIRGPVGCRYLRYRARSHQTFTRDGGSMTIRPHNCITNNCPGSEEIVSAVFVILLMFCAVIVMVTRVDNNRKKCAARVYRFERHEKLDSQS